MGSRTVLLVWGVLALGCNERVPGGGSSGTGTDGTTSATQSTGSTSAASTGVSGSTSGTTGTSTGSSSGSDFVMPPDGGGVCVVAGPGRLSCCDPTQQDCPDGEKCTPYSNDGSGNHNGTYCGAIDPDPGQLGEPCTIAGPGAPTDSCDVWLMCLFRDPETSMGTCVQICDPWDLDPGCTDDTQQCVVFNDGVLTICADPCHPLTNPCPAKEVCVADTDGVFVCMPDAWPDTGLGEACRVTHGCGAGAYCEDADLVPGCTDPYRCCTEYCDLNAPVCTDVAATCQPFYGGAMAPAGFEDLGACRVQ